MALEETGLKFIAQDEDKFEAAVNSASGSVDKFEKSAGEAGQTVDAYSKQNTSAAFSITDLNSAIAIGGRILSAAKQGYDEVITSTLNYAEGIRSLQRNIGATAEEASKLIQAADDVKISQGSLENALEAAIRKGVRPTIEGIGELADKYVLIQDPIQKTKFLMDNFGRSGADLAPLMALGADGIKELGDKAEATGLVMSEQGVKNARAYEIAVDDLTDTWHGFTTQLGNTVIPFLTKFVDDTNKRIDIEKKEIDAVNAGRMSWIDMMTTNWAVNIGFETLDNTLAKVTQKVTDNTAAKRNDIYASNNYKNAIDGVAESQDAVALATQKATDEATKHKAAADLLAAGLSGVLQKAQQTYVDTFTTSQAKTIGLREEINKLALAGGNNADKIYDLNQQVFALEKKEDDAKEAMKKATAEFIFQKAAVNLDTDASVELAHSMGLLDDQSYNAAKSVQDLRTKFDSNKDGAIDAAEAARGYTRAVSGLADTINSVQSKAVSVVVNYTSTGNPGTNYGNHATGGNMNENEPGIIGERGPELYTPNRSGNVSPTSIFQDLFGEVTDTITQSMAQMVSTITHVNNSPNYNYSPTYQGQPRSPVDDFAVLKVLTS